MKAHSWNRLACATLMAILSPAIQTVHAGTVHVWSGGGHEEPYDTWAKAASNIQTAVDFAQDNIGTYPTVLLTNETFTISEQISITGGITVRGVDRDTTVVRRSVTGNNDPKHRIFRVDHADAVVESLTMQYGHPDNSGSETGTHGGGVKLLLGLVRNCVIRDGVGQDGQRGVGIWMSGGTVDDCVITTCTGRDQGVGIWMSGGTVLDSVITACTGRNQGAGIYLGGGVVSNTLIHANVNTWNGIGVGAYVAGGLLIDSILSGNEPGAGGATAGGAFVNGGDVIGCTVIGNRAGRGGGIELSSGLVASCIITNNTASGTGGRGGGVYQTGGTLHNSLLARNVAQRNAADAGGGVYMTGGAVESCTIAENQASHANGTGGGVYATGGSLINSIVYFNIAGAGGANLALSGTATITYSCADPKPDGEGNEGGDPLFTSRSTMDYTLLPGSPALDAGDEQPWMLEAGATDLAGLDRISGDTVDIGAYEREYTLACSFTADVTRGLAPLSVTLEAFTFGDPDPTALHYFWDLDNDGEWDEDGVGLAVVSTDFPAGLHSIALMVSNVTTEATATYLASDYIVSAPETMYLSVTGTQTIPYDTWATAATNPAAPLVLATDGVTILASNGTYLVNGQLTVAHAVTIQGLNAGGPVRFERNVASVGDHPQFRVFKLTHPEVMLSGLTIAKGFAFESLLAGDIEQGGGIWMSGGTVVDCVITDCLASGSTSAGAGLYLGGGVVSNTLIHANTARWSSRGAGAYVAGGLLIDSILSGNERGPGGSNGGGVFVDGGDVIGCTVADNEASRGGGIELSSGLVASCIVTNNSASGSGGGVHQTGGTLRNSLLARNVAERNAADAGGGVWMTGGAIESCTIAENQASHANGTGGGVYATAGSLINSIVYFNTAGAGGNNLALSGTATITYSCADPEPDGEGNEGGDPLFTSRSTMDYTLLPGSPALDAGDEQPWMLEAGATDLAGLDRISGDTVDMGAYEREYTLACSFTAEVTRGLAPLSVTLTAQVTGDPDPAALHYFWDLDNDGGWDEDGVGLTIVSTDFSAGLHSIALMVSNVTTEATAMYLASDYIVSAPETMYLSVTGTQTIPYDTWATAATNPAAPLVLAADGVTILASNGTYFVNGQLTVAHAVTIQGLNAGGPVRFERKVASVGDEPRFRVFKLTNPEAMLSGLTIAKGYALESLLAGTILQGGGIWMSGGTVLDCVITACLASGSTSAGAGLYLGGGVVSNTLIHANTINWNGKGGAYVVGGLLVDSILSGSDTSAGGSNGGGVFVNGGEVIGCTVTGNRAGRGGGIELSSGLVATCIVTNNTATGSGGGVYQTGGTLRNSLIARNVAQRNAADAGGGVYLTGGAIENSTIVTNLASHASSTGGGLYASGGAVTNAIIYFNTAGSGNHDVARTGSAAIGYSCAPELTSGTGNIQDNPLFVDVDADDFRLTSPSPCIDAGHPGPYDGNLAWIAMSGALDLGGGPRLLNNGVDMGAYETLVPPSGTLILLR